MVGTTSPFGANSVLSPKLSSGPFGTYLPDKKNFAPRESRATELLGLLASTHSDLSETTLQEARSLAEERDPEMFWAGALQLGLRLKQGERYEPAAALLNWVSQKGGTEAIRAKAAAEREALIGGGSAGLRAEFLFSRLASDAMDYRVILPMIGASLVGQVAGAATWGRLANLGASWYSRGAPARALAGLAAFSAEVPALALAGRALGPHGGSFGEDLGRSALSLGAMRAFGFAGRQASPHLKWGSGAFPHLSTYGGLMAAHKLEEQLGLRPTIPGANPWLDALASWASMSVGANLGRRMLGKNFAAWEQDLAQRPAAQGKTETPIGNFGWGLAPAGAVSLPLPKSSLSLGPRPTGMMMSWWGKKSGFFAEGTGVGKERWMGGQPPSNPPGSPPGGNPPGGKPPPGDSRMDESYSIAGAIVRDKLAPEAKSALEKIKDKELLVVRGNYDHIDRVLQALGVPFAEIDPDHINPNLLQGAKFAFINCGTHFSQNSAETLGRWVETGGLMMTTDWALKTVLEVAFRDDRGQPLYVRHNGIKTGNLKPAGQRHELVGITDYKKDEPGIEGYWNQGEPQWWLEPSSYPIEILAKGHVEVLARSEELGKRYGADPVIVRFRHGMGGVIHMISHFFLQHGGAKQGELDAEASIYATSMGASSKVVEAIKRTQGKTGVTAGTVRSATSSVSFVANTITSHFTQKPPVPTGAKPPVRPQPLTSTVMPEATVIGQMMGISSMVSVPVPEAANQLPWRPGTTAGIGWKWSSGHWSLQMAADKNEIIVGRLGDAQILDKRPKTHVSRRHAKIKRLGVDGSEFSITALDGDVSIIRPGEGPIYLQANRGGEGDGTWLLPGDRVRLTPDVEFIFDPVLPPKTS